MKTKKICKNCKFYCEEYHSCSCDKWICSYHTDKPILDDCIQVECDEGWGFAPGKLFGCIHWKRKREKTNKDEDDEVSYEEYKQMDYEYRLYKDD